MKLNLQQILGYIDESRLVMSWVDILDIGVIAIFLSVALVWLRRRASRSILFVLVMSLLTFATAKSLKMYLTSMVFQFGLTALALSIVIIFQEDFRRAFESLASWTLRGSGDVLAPGKIINLLVECLVSFSKAKTGALIVLQGRQSLDSHVRAGILVRGRLSVPLLQSIFDHHSPGHDGGVTIVDGRIDKLGVHLPLSRHTENTGRLGTRHAAALGLAEKCDALVLVVSEETGTMSIARDGRIDAVKAASTVRDAIRDHYRRLGPMSVPRTLLTIPWGRLTVASALSFALWLLFARPSNLIQRMVEVPIVYRSLPRGWEAKPPVPQRVKLTLFGPEGSVMRLEPAGMPFSVDLTRVSEGQQRFILSEGDLVLPARVRLKRVEPSEVIVRAYPTVDYEVPVQLAWMPLGDRTLSSAQFSINPGRVTIRVPKDSVMPKSLDTEPIDLRELRRLQKVQVKLRLPPDAQMAEMATPEVQVILLAPAKR